MIDDKILEALQKATTAAVLASTMPNLPVKYMGRTWSTPNDFKWLEFIYIPNNPNDQYWADGEVYRGLARLILHWPINNEGFYEPMALIASIAEGFQKGQYFTDPDNIAAVKIQQHPKLLNTLEAPPENIFPISISYHCFKP